MCLSLSVRDLGKNVLQKQSHIKVIVQILFYEQQENSENMIPRGEREWIITALNNNIINTDIITNGQLKLVEI